MGKIERENRRALFRVRAREMRIRGRMVRILFLAVLAAVTVSALVGTDQSGMAGNQVHMMYLPVFVSWGMTAGILYGIAATWNYREGNRLLGMYPQNNRTRFWSYVLLMHAAGLACVAAGAALYLVLEGILWLISLSPVNLTLVYPFHAGLFFAGTAAALAIVWGLQDLLAFWEAAYLYLGKKVYLAVVLLIAAAFAGSGQGLRFFLNEILPFWTAESSLFRFYLKMAGTGTVFLVMAGWLTARTEYYRPKPALKGVGWIVEVVCLAAVPAFLNTAYTAYTDSNGTIVYGGGASWESVAAIEEILAEKEEKMTGQEWELAMPAETKSWTLTTYGMEYPICYAREAEDLEPGTIRIRYFPLTKYLNDVAIGDNRTVTVTVLEEAGEIRAEGKVTSFQEYRLCYLSPCGSWMNQFSCFQDRELYRTFDGMSVRTENGFLLAEYPKGTRVEIGE